MKPGTVITVIALLILSSVQLNAQNNTEPYEPPEVIEGSNLYINAYPSISASKSASSENIVNYNLDFGSSFEKWRFTRMLDYDLRVSVYGNIYKNEHALLTDLTEVHHSARFAFGLYGTGSRYIIKDKIYTGLYARSNNYFSSDDKPSINLSINPNIGFGRVVDAYVVNQAGNIENILIGEGFTGGKLTARTKRLLNNLLDKRDMREFYSKYSDDYEVEFFTKLEKLLLDEKTIERPLNARTTMKIYQSLFNEKFILFPLLKGWNVQGELGYVYGNDTPDTAHYATTITISGLYGVPLSPKASLLFSSAFVFPINKNYNTGDYSFDITSPVVIRAANNLHSEEGALYNNFDIYREGLFDYKSVTQVHLFYNLSNFAGISGILKYSMGKRKDKDNFDHRLSGNAVFLYNILNKLRLQSSLYVETFNEYDYRLSFSTGIIYILF